MYTGFWDITGMVQNQSDSQDKAHSGIQTWKNLQSPCLLIADNPSRIPLKRFQITAF